MKQGGGVAAPVGGQIFSEVLPYLEVEQGNQDEIEHIEQVEIPDVVGMNLNDAEKKLKELDLIMNITGTEEIDEQSRKDIIVREQVPKPGIFVNEKTNVYLYK